jgi:hypothetical protein
MKYHNILINSEDQYQSPIKIHTGKSNSNNNSNIGGVRRGREDFNLQFKPY